MNLFEVYKSDIIVDNQQKFIDQLLEFHNRTNYRTDNFHEYNIFSEVTTNEMYDLFSNVKAIIRNQLPANRLWMQAWLNVHKQNECLDWHSHTFDWHGYISIDPKNTTTEFAHWKIDNEVGNIYFGPGGELHKHRVNVNEAYDDYRITIGFDVQTSATQSLNKFIPIL